MSNINNMREFSQELEKLLNIETLYLKIPLQEIGKELDMPIGMSVGENILRYLKKIKEGEKK